MYVSDELRDCLEAMLLTIYFVLSESHVHSLYFYPFHIVDHNRDNNLAIPASELDRFREGNDLQNTRSL